MSKPLCTLTVKWIRPLMQLCPTANEWTSRPEIFKWMCSVEIKQLKQPELISQPVQFYYLQLLFIALDHSRYADTSSEHDSLVTPGRDAVVVAIRGNISSFYQNVTSTIGTTLRIRGEEHLVVTDKTKDPPVVDFSQKTLRFPVLIGKLSLQDETLRAHSCQQSCLHVCGWIARARSAVQNYYNLPEAILPNMPEVNAQWLQTFRWMEQSLEVGMLWLKFASSPPVDHTYGSYVQMFAFLASKHPMDQYNGNQSSMVFCHAARVHYHLLLAEQSETQAHFGKAMAHYLAAIQKGEDVLEMVGGEEILERLEEAVRLNEQVVPARDSLLSEFDVASPQWQAMNKIRRKLKSDSTSTLFETELSKVVVFPRIL